MIEELKAKFEDLAKVVEGLTSAEPSVEKVVVDAVVAALVAAGYTVTPPGAPEDPPADGSTSIPVTSEG